VFLLKDIDMFRVKQLNPRQGTVRRQWLVLVEGCNAVLGQLLNSLRASREASVRCVTSLGKDQPFPAKRALRTNASRLAEHINIL
jgi:hypothetical protein